MFSPTRWRSQGISDKCSQASSASSGLNGAGQASGRRSFSGILVLEQDTPPKAVERREQLLSYSQFFLGRPALSSRQRILSTSRVFVALHQHSPKGPPPATCPHEKGAPNPDGQGACVPGADLASGSNIPELSQAV